MQFELDDATEVELLRQALGDHLEELRHEWSRTEDRTYRHDLWSTILRLEAILGRLPSARETARLARE